MRFSLSFPVLAVALLALSGRADAQSSQQPKSSGRNGTLAAVTVTASAPKGATERQNRRLSAELHRADRRIAELEEKLVVVKAEHDRKVAGIAALESSAADARRRREALEAKVRELEARNVTSRTASAPEQQ
jgi:chromosome segregation ATPase